MNPQIEGAMVLQYQIGKRFIPDLFCFATSSLASELGIFLKK
jgi:hypothetical protein